VAFIVSGENRASPFAGV
jgi:hypothetical protein